MPKISIIVPVYNVEKYLKRCLDSILKQTFSDFEVLCTNDGSTDDSLCILKEYSDRDERVKFFDQSNQGAAIARNRSLENSKGEYVAFVDPDDWCKPNMLEVLYNEAIRDDLDIVIAQGYSYHSNRLIFKYTKGTYKFKRLPKICFDRVFSAQDLKDKIFRLPVPVFLKLYKREFIERNNLRFPNIRTSEDQLFFAVSILLANRIKCVDKFVYYYSKMREGSHSSKRKIHAKDAIQVFYDIENELEKRGLLPRFEKEFLGKYARNSLKWLKKADMSVREEYFILLKKQMEHIESKYDKELLRKFNWYLDFEKIKNS